MAKSAAPTVDEYLRDLPEDRRAVIAVLRQLILDRLPAGYRETLNWGMISYELPLERYPKTYNGQPLMYAALAAQKQHYSLYLTCVYQDPVLHDQLRQAFANAGKKLDMGKACVRFRRLEDLPLDVIGDVIASVPPDKFVAAYERAKAR